jgi:alpha-galactosidase
MRRIYALCALLGIVVIAGVERDPVLAQDALAIRGAAPPANGVWLDSLDLSKMVQRRGTPRAGRSGASGERGNPTPPPLKLGGVTYEHGIGTLSINELIIDLKGEATRFVSMIGIDDAITREGSVTYEIWLDDKKKLITDVLKAGGPPQFVSIDVTGGRMLELVINDGGDTSNSDYADWAGAAIVMKPGSTAKPETWTFPSEAAPPIAASRAFAGAPRLNAPFITGATPGRPFLFRIPASGQAPLTFAATNLPAGLTLDPATGIISGALSAAGQTNVIVTVSNSAGRAMHSLAIVGGPDALARTPPLGWNSWNVWGTTVDDAKVRAAADAMVSSGLASVGFQYINIDDGWEGKRDASGKLPANDKFPDMKALADYIHSRGLKLGIYSSPGPGTCGGFAGSYQHEEADARMWADWGVDLLKHDWCSYSRIAKDDSLAELQKPYIVMRDALAKTDRDIVYSLCQYGMGNVWEWGADVGGNYWRVSGDLTDVWSNMSPIGFRQAGREKWTRPGHYTDPDMLVVGKVGWGPSVHDTRLTPNEQVTHISLWALEAAPLLLGADMSQFDPFTTNLMTNEEVIAVDQDQLVKAASRVVQSERLEVWARPLADGTMAVGLFNRGLHASKVTVPWSALSLRGAQPVRDLWQQKSLGSATDAFTAMVPAHGAVLVKIGAPKR